MDGAGGGRDTERPHPSRDTHQQHPPSGSVRRQERRCTTTATARDGIEPHGCDYLEASPRTSTTTAPAATTSTLLPGHSHLTLTSTSPTTAPRELDKLNLDRHEDEPRRCRRWMRRNWAVFPWVFNAIFRKDRSSSPRPTFSKPRDVDNDTRQQRTRHRGHPHLPTPPNT